MCYEVMGRLRDQIGCLFSPFICMIQIHTDKLAPPYPAIAYLIAHKFFHSLPS
jgi:hypothetical protein